MTVLQDLLCIYCEVECFCGRLEAKFYQILLEGNKGRFKQISSFFNTVYPLFLESKKICKIHVIKRAKNEVDCVI